MSTLRSLAVVLVITTLFAGTPALAASNEAVKRNNFGAELAKQGRLEEALSEFRLAVQADPRFATAQMNLAYTYEKLNRGDEAIAAYKKTIELDPRNRTAFNNLGVLYMDKGLYDEALQVIEQGLKVDPNDGTLQKNLEIAKTNLAHVNERDTEIAAARKQAELLPKDPRAAYNLARAYSAFHMQDQALEWLDKAFQLGFKDIPLLRDDPALSGLRQDPRYTRLMEGR